MLFPLLLEKTTIPGQVKQIKQAKHRTNCQNSSNDVTTFPTHQSPPPNVVYIFCTVCSRCLLSTKDTIRTGYKEQAPKRQMISSLLSTLL